MYNNLYYFKRSLRYIINKYLRILYVFPILFQRYIFIHQIFDKLNEN